MNRTLIAIIASVLLSEASQLQFALASTPSSADPIHLDVCTATITSHARSLQLRFVNVTSITVGAVLFTVQVGSWRSEFRDVGQFSPNVKIDHMFKLDLDPCAPFGMRPTQAQCAVKRVDFITVDRY